MCFKIILILSVFLGSSQAAWNATCDLDLPNIKVIINYLPKQCKEIYEKGSESEAYKKSLEESESFVKFSKQLEEHERTKKLTQDQKNKLRLDIYNVTLLNKCATDVGDKNRTDLATDSDRTYALYDCLIKKRDEMVKLIPN